MIGEIKTKATQVIENIPKIYENGKSAGYSKGSREGHEEGKQEQYDLFWDTIQNKGGRRDYRYMFYGFPGALFNPKHNFRATFSTTDTLGYAFATSTITDMVKNTDCTDLYGTLNYTWYNCKDLVNARTIIAHERFNYSYAFYGCVVAKSITASFSQLQTSSSAF